MENLTVPGYFRGEKPGKGQEVCLQLCGVADKKWFLARKSKFFENAYFSCFKRKNPVI